MKKICYITGDRAKKKISINLCFTVSQVEVGSRLEALGAVVEERLQAVLESKKRRKKNLVILVRFVSANTEY